MKMRQCCAASALTVLLGACSILPKSEAPNIYLLPAAAATVTTPRATAQQSVRITTPHAARALDSARIAVVPRDNMITAYQGARWSDRAPRLLRDRLLDAFRADGRFAASSSDDARLQADMELTGDLRAFQTEYSSGQPVVSIRYDAQLADTRSQKIVGTRRFDIRQPVAGKQVPQVVVAFGQATDELSAQVVAWVAATSPGTKSR
ncbi:MAG: ABC-type transport auxiliary lipoprotein family protein [Rhodanobacter sp.]